MLDSSIVRLAHTIYKSRFSFLLKHYRQGNILDIGNVGGVRSSGHSHSFHAQFKAIVEPRSTVFGIDLSEPIDRDKTLVTHQFKANVDEGLPFAPMSFDTVYMGQDLEHLYKPFQALCEIHRVLKTDGVFICDIPNPYSLSRVLRYTLLKKDNLEHPSHVNSFTPASLAIHLELSGFAITELATDWKERAAWFPKAWKIGLGTHLLVAGSKSAPRCGSED
jgi:SAM-dependent methyltransferase